MLSDVTVTKAPNGESVTVTDNHDGTWSFTMPSSDVNVTPAITGSRHHFLISFDANVRITESGNDPIEQDGVLAYKTGEKITFVILPPAETYALQSLEVYQTNNQNVTCELTDEGFGYYSFIMPEYDVTVKPNFAVTCYGISRPEGMTIDVLSHDGTQEMNGHLYYKKDAQIQVTVSPPDGQMVFDNEETTSLSEELRVESEEFATAAEWYTLDGRRLEGRPTQRSVYINNHHKVVISSVSR